MVHFDLCAGERGAFTMQRLCHPGSWSRIGPGDVGGFSESLGKGHVETGLTCGFGRLHIPVWKKEMLRFLTVIWFTLSQSRQVVCRGRPRHWGKELQQEKIIWKITGWEKKIGIYLYGHIFSYPSRDKSTSDAKLLSNTETKLYNFVCSESLAAPGTERLGSD